MVKSFAGQGQGMDPWELLLILILLLSFGVGIYGALIGAHAAEAVECKPRLIGFIEKCDVTGCRVQLADGTYGHGKLPLEFAKVSEVCQ